MNHKNQEDKDNQEETTIQRKSWQDGGGDTGGNDNSSPNNNDGFTDNSQSAKDALQLQKMAEASSEYIQLKKWADNIGGGGDATPNDNPIQKKENKTGLPDKLKTGMENNSGMSMDDVKVHRNSEKPAQLNAHAYAQGTDIHLGPGQEKHLPHELGHVVQQKQGIVKPTTQQNGAAINDDKGLEKNADILGAKALQPTAQLKAKDTGPNNSISNLSQVIQQWQMEDKAKMNNNSIQRKVVQLMRNDTVHQLEDDGSDNDTTEVKPQETAETTADATGDAANTADNVSTTADSLGADGVADTSADIAAKLSSAESKIRSVIPFLPSSVEWTTPDGKAFDPNGEPSGMVKAKWVDMSLVKDKEFVNKNIGPFGPFPVGNLFDIELGGNLTATLNELKAGHIEVCLNFDDESLQANGQLGASVGYLGSIYGDISKPIDILPGILRLEPGVKSTFSFQPAGGGIQPSANWSMDLAKSATVKADGKIPKTNVERKTKVEAYGKLIVFGDPLLDYTGTIYESDWAATKLNLPNNDIPFALILSNDPNQVPSVEMGDIAFDLDVVDKIRDFFKSKRKEARKEKRLKDAEKQAEQKGKDHELE